jgi:hypothetical protein
MRHDQPQGCSILHTRQTATESMLITVSRRPTPDKAVTRQLNSPRLSRLCPALRLNAALCTLPGHIPGIDRNLSRVAALSRTFYCT